MTKTLTLVFAKIFAVFAGLFLLCVSALADCTGRTTSAQPGSPFQWGKTFLLGNNGSQGYWHNYRTHCDDGDTNCSNGADIYSACAVDMNVGSGMADEGLAIIAVADGTVYFVGNIDGFGYTVKIDHSSTTRSQYSHLAFDPSKKPGLKPSDTVRRGSVIGFLGNTGNSSSSHLHFEWQEKFGDYWKSMDFTTMDNQTVSSGAQLTSTENNVLIFLNNAVTYPDGTFVKNMNNDTIYYVDGGQLRPFTSSEHFRSWYPYYTVNMPIASVLPVANSATIAAYSTGANMSFRPGTLLRSDTANDNIPNSMFYLVVNDNGTIRKVPKTFSEISAMGFEEGSAMVVPSSLITTLPGGSGPVELAQTSLYTDSDLVAYYRLENTNDTKGSNNLTNNGSVTFISAKFNNGAEGGSANTTKSLTVSSNLSYTGGAYSIAGWAKINTELTTANQQYSLFSVQDGITKTGLQIYYSETGEGSGYFLNFQRTKNYVGADNALYSLSSGLGTADWHLFALTYDGTNLRGYLDGSLVAGPTSASGSGTTQGTSGASILCEVLGASGGVNMRASAIADDVAFFSRALTAAEVSSLFTGN
jgi:hypothetical protein